MHDMAIMWNTDGSKWSRVEVELGEGIADLQTWHCMQSVWQGSLVNGNENCLGYLSDLFIMYT